MIKITKYFFPKKFVLLAYQKACFLSPGLSHTNTYTHACNAHIHKNLLSVLPHDCINKIILLLKSYLTFLSSDVVTSLFLKQLNFHQAFLPCTVHKHSCPPHSLINLHSHCTLIKVKITKNPQTEKTTHGNSIKVAQIRNIDGNVPVLSTLASL